MERTRVWSGALRADARQDHEKFVGWLGSTEAATQFAKFGLMSYSLAEHGDHLTVTMTGAEPLVFIRFLRNHRMWPDFWEYQSAEAAQPGSVGEVRVSWRRGAEDAPPDQDGSG